MGPVRPNVAQAVLAADVDPFRPPARLAGIRSLHEWRDHGGEPALKPFAQRHKTGPRVGHVDSRRTELLKQRPSVGQPREKGLFYPSGCGLCLLASVRAGHCPRKGRRIERVTADTSYSM